MLTPESVQACLEAHSWTFAKTMPKVPHFYTLRKHWKGPLEFEAVVQWMRDHGKVMKWGRYVRPYFDAGPFRYWTMGSPLSETILINRELIAGSKAVPHDGPPDPVR